MKIYKMKIQYRYFDEGYCQEWHFHNNYENREDATYERYRLQNLGFRVCFKLRKA